jgi:hypothetical protein
MDRIVRMELIFCDSTPKNYSAKLYSFSCDIELQSIASFHLHPLLRPELRQASQQVLYLGLGQHSERLSFPHHRQLNTLLVYLVSLL